MFQNPYQRCQYELETHPDGKVWLGSLSGESEMHYVNCIGRTLALLGPRKCYYDFKNSLGKEGTTPAEQINAYLLKHGVVVYRYQ